ncbi:Sulfopyruvate decarboxylase subunit alpha [Nitrosopumilaceae archaeon]|nr:Sulfopyruvate decarboxylase subunit alpha [Nitrosopumilaceae archaeon]
MHRKGVTDFVGVPDSTLKHFIDEGLGRKKILIATREEEAIGIAAGMSMSGGTPLVFMQNAGLANSISTITSLVRMYEIPMILVVGWRGYLRDDAPEHLAVGRIQQRLLRLAGVTSRIMTEENWRERCDWALDSARSGRPCALVVRRMFHD